MSNQRAAAASDDDLRQLGDILQELAGIAPDDVQAFRVLALDTLKRRKQEHLDAILQGILRSH